MLSFRKPLCLWLGLFFLAGNLPAEQEVKPATPTPAEKAKDGDKKAKGDKKKRDKDKDKPKDGEKATGGDKGKEKDGDKGKKDKKGGKDGAATDGSNGRLSLPLVKDQPSKGLKIPYYDGQGNLQMVFNIGVANKIDADNVEMQEMQVETYNEEGEPEMTVDLPTSVLDLNTRVVTSHTKTTITREDFVITGDSVKFNTLTRQGTLVGNVHMIINNLNEEVEPPPTEAPSGQ